MTEINGDGFDDVDELIGSYYDESYAPNEDTSGSAGDLIYLTGEKLEELARKHSHHRDVVADLLGLRDWLIRGETS